MYKQFWIYRITNSITNKFYIGQTKNLYNRLKSHKSCKDKNTIIVKSIIKYGWENHVHDILFFSENITKKEADEIEKYYIKKYNSFCKNNKLGMNLTDGGYYGSITKYSFKKQEINNFKIWRKRLNKSESNLVVMNIEGEILFRYDGNTFSGLIKKIGKYSYQRRNAIRSAINKKFWTCTDRKFIIGFEDEDIYNKYLLEKQQRCNHAKNKPVSENSIKALMDYHNNTHDIPVLNLNVGVYYNTVTEFAKEEGVTNSTIMERFAKGYYSYTHLLCKN